MLFKGHRFSIHNLFLFENSFYFNANRPKESLLQIKKTLFLIGNKCPYLSPHLFGQNHYSINHSLEKENKKERKEEEGKEKDVDRGPFFAYCEMVKLNRLKDNDRRQEAAVLCLQHLHDSILKQEKFVLNSKSCVLDKTRISSSPSPSPSSSSLAPIHSFLSSITSSYSPSSSSSSSPPPPPTPTPSLKGLYLFGSPGRGKTMLMDIFFHRLPTSRKLRIHFHAFMLDIHARLHALQSDKEWRKKEESASSFFPSFPSLHSLRSLLFRSSDPIDIIACQISKEYDVICLDEMEVLDIADALLLLRLFSFLWKMPFGFGPWSSSSSGFRFGHRLGTWLGTRLGFKFGNQPPILVCTSNLHPDFLYHKGLNRSLFLPFIHLVKNNCTIIDLNDAMVGDYRKKEKDKLNITFLSPLNQNTNQAMDETFFTLTGRRKGEKKEIKTAFNRTITVNDAFKSIARFSFGQICAVDWGPSDYLEIAKNFSVIFVKEIPWLGDPALENEARRMITLIDILYESRCLIICSSSVPLKFLFSSSPAPSSSSNQSEHAFKDYLYNPIPDKREIKEDEDEEDEEDEIFHTMKGESERQDEKQDTVRVVDDGGSSGRSTTMIRGMEWSATGLVKASLSKYSNYSFFARVAVARTHSRLQEMQTMEYVQNSIASTRIVNKIIGNQFNET